MQSTDCHQNEAEHALAKADNRGKLAIMMILSSLKKQEAETLLNEKRASG